MLWAQHLLLLNILLYHLWHFYSVAFLVSAKFSLTSERIFHSPLKYSLLCFRSIEQINLVNSYLSRSHETSIKLGLPKRPDLGPEYISLPCSVFLSNLC